MALLRAMKAESWWGLWEVGLALWPYFSGRWRGNDAIEIYIVYAMGRR